MLPLGKLILIQHQFDMKNLLYLACALVCSALFVGCSKTPEKSEVALEMNISNITATDFTLDIKCSDPEFIYFFGLSPRDMYDFNNPKAVAEEFVRNSESVVDDWTKVDNEYVHKGNKTVQAKDFWTIKPEREYALLLFGVGPNGEITTDPICKFVTTPAEETVPALELNISNETATSFTIDIASTDPQLLYYVGVTNKADFDRLGDPTAVAEGFVQIENEKGLIEWTKADGQLVHQGSKTIEAEDMWSLLPKREYAVVAFGVGAGGSITTDPVCEFVTTTAVSPSENVLTVSVAEETGVVKVSATNDDPYFLDCIEADRLTDVPEERLAEHIIGIYGGNIESCIEQGSVERDFSRILEEDCDYCAVAFGYVGGYATTEVVLVKFHSAGGELVPQDCTFEFKVENITTNGASVTVTPSNPETSYFWQVYNSNLVNSYLEGAGLGQLMADGLAIIAEAFSEEYGFEITPEAAAGMVSVTGEDSYVYTDWDPDTEYYVVAVGLDDKGRQTTDVQLSEPFRTLPLSAGSDTPMDCVIQVNGLTDEGISITVTPADKEMTYVGMVGEADFYALYESDDEYLTDDVAMWSEMAAAEGLGLAEIFDMFGLFLQGDQTFIFSSELDTINPGTLYLAYTYGLSEEGELTTGMQKVFFTVDENGDAHEAEAPAGM